MNKLTHGTTAQQNAMKTRQGKVYNVSCNTHPHPLLENSEHKQGGGYFCIKHTIYKDTRNEDHHALNRNEHRALDEMPRRQTAGAGLTNTLTFDEGRDGAWNLGSPPRARLAAPLCARVGAPRSSRRVRGGTPRSSAEEEEKAADDSISPSPGLLSHGDGRLSAELTPAKH